MQHRNFLAVLALAAGSFLSGCSGCGDNLGTSPDAAGDADDALPPDGMPQMLGPEIAVDDIGTGTTGQNALTPYLASDGTSYFAVWADNRLSNRQDIYGARISATGTLTDMFGIAINTAAGRQTTPVAAWVGDRWLVVWNNAGDIAGATVSTAGVVTQLPAITTTVATESAPAIAASGTTAIIAWQSGNDVVGAQYAAGTVGASFNIAATATAETDPAVAASPSGFLVAYTEDGVDIRGRLIAAGAPSGASFVISPAANEQAEPAVAFNGTDYVVAYDNLTDIYATRVSTTGTIVDANGVLIAAGPALQSLPSIACDATSCFVSFLDNRTFATTGYDVYGQKFASDLTLQGNNVAVSASSRYEDRPTVASSASGYLTTWEDNRSGGATLAFASRISAAGAVLDANGFLVNANRNAQLDPALATTAGSQLAVWSDSRAVGNDIESSRYTGPGGSLISTTATAVSGATGEQSTPSVTFDGTQYLAVWADARTSPAFDIFAARFSLGGSLMDATAIPVTTATGFQVGPDVASGGGVSLAVWGDRRSGGFDIYGAIITPAGAVSVPDIQISTAANDQNSPAVVYDAADNVFIVVWSDNRSGVAPNIYAARVSPAGAVLDANGVQLSNAANGQFRPDVAVSEGLIVALWDDRRTDATGDIYATRLSAASGLTVTDPTGILISGAADQQTSPTILGLPGKRFVAAWTDNRNAATTGFDIYAAELGSNGTPSTATGFVVSNEAGDEAQPALSGSTSAGAGTAIVYQAYRPAVGTTRVFRRTMYLP